MPLKKGVKFIGGNIHELMEHGRSHAQSVAIAMKVAGKSTKPRK